MKFKQIPWKYDEGFGIGGAWYGDLVVRYFITPPIQNRTGKFKASIGLGDRQIGEFKSLEEAKKGVQSHHETLIMTAFES